MKNEVVTYYVLEEWIEQLPVLRLWFKPFWREIATFNSKADAEDGLLEYMSRYSQPYTRGRQFRISVRTVPYISQGGKR